jgi:Flp pilus assembly protein TadG
MVEFALVLPILIALICGIIDFGWMFYNYLALQNACREGARRACVISQDTNYYDDVELRVKQALPQGLQDTLKLTVDYSEPTEPTKGDVTVTTEANIYFLTPVLGTVYKEEHGGKKISATLVMKVES